MPASARSAGAEPGSARNTVCVPRNGAAIAEAANLAPNSPKLANWARSRMSPNVATSQKAVVPPLPSTTSYPSGTENSSASPRRSRATCSRTGFWRCEVPRYVVDTRDSASTAAGRTLLGPQPKRPSAGLISSGIRMSATGCASWSGRLTADSSDQSGSRASPGGPDRSPLHPLAAGADRQLAGEHGTCAPVHREGVGAPAAAGQRDHELHVEPLVQGVLGDQAGQLRHHLQVAAQREGRLDAQGGGRQAEFLQPGDLAAGGIDVRAVGQRGAAPQS